MSVFQAAVWWCQSHGVIITSGMVAPTVQTASVTSDIGCFGYPIEAIWLDLKSPVCCRSSNQASPLNDNPHGSQIGAASHGWASEQYTLSSETDILGKHHVRIIGKTV